LTAAARDVQAAITPRAACCPRVAEQSDVSESQPADAPIMILALTSETMTQGQMYDAASTILAQKLSQVDGIGPV